MTKDEVMALLEANKNERGMAHWAKMKDTGGLSGFGMGMTQLRKLAKQVGRDHERSLELWQVPNVEAKIISCLTDEPKKITREQVEAQVEGLGFGYLTHAYSSCDATLAKAKLAVELAPEWMHSEHEMRQRCAYGLYYELSKNQRDKTLTDEYFIECIDKIRSIYSDALSGPLKGAMGGALMGIGKRNIKLNALALALAKQIGPIDFSEEGGKCDPMDVVKHLTSDYLKKKLEATPV